MREPFNEQRLLADVAKQWGEHGAHADVLRALIANLECGTANPSFATLTAELAAERAEVERLRAVLSDVVENEQRCISAENGWRALADQLAEWLLRIVPDQDRDLNDALTEWEARRER